MHLPSVFPGLVILDIWLQGSELDGLGILEIAQSKYPTVPFIMISGHGTIETAVNAIRMGAYDFIEKPFNSERLMHIVQRTVEMARLKNENRELKMRGKPESQLIGSSIAINTIRQTIEKVAPTNSRILITGEEGTGKEVVARMIHDQSMRAKGNFVVMNAGSLSPSQVDTELFGVEDATPTGGAQRLGLFERAHGGTLFIDEIGDMNIETQGRILRTLHDQSFERVHGKKRVTVDVRVIAASNRDLKAEIATGRFREDLFYRLNIVPIHMPSLRERREDIAELCTCFMERAAETSGLAPRTISEDAMAILQSYSWPGNVRHLRNIMEWLLIMAPGDANQPVETDHLPPELTGNTFNHYETGR